MSVVSYRAQHQTAALIVAGGSGQRFGHDTPKQFHTLDGKMVLRHAIEAFYHHPDIDLVVVVHPADWSQATQIALNDLNDVAKICGGDSRQQSVFLGLKYLADQGGIEKILIHDGARPLVTRDLIDRTLAALSNARAVIPGLAVTDTLKQTITTAHDSHVVRTVNRQDFARIQTPQAFMFDDIFQAHQQFKDQMLSDDAALIEASGGSVCIIPGDPANIKITHADDLRLAHILRTQHGSTRPYADIRTGTGFDVHRLVPGDGVIICGHKIACGWRLDGHSDADVGLHALCDAIFGALADGDIGQHFPPSDPQWRGADSAQFLLYALKRVNMRGGRLNHIDVTIICEQPKIGPHRTDMIVRLSALTGLPADRIGLKATTTEKLGFAGRGEGIAAQACATVVFP